MNHTETGKPGISVVIPCLNEYGTIARAVAAAFAGLRETGLNGEVIVADNGSTDNSQELAIAAGARVVNIPARGYGSALKGGFAAAEYEWIVFADADLSYPFAELPKLIEPLQRGEAEFVLGTRLRGQIASGAMPFLNRHLGTPVLSLLIRLSQRLPTSDCNSGMRAISKRKYRELRMRCPGMEFASEMLVRVGQKRLRYAEVPISFAKDQRGRAPHLRRWRDGWRHLRFILGYAPSLPTVAAPAAIGFSLLGLSFISSFIATEDGAIHYHSAFGLCALALPFLLIAMASMLVKSLLAHSGGLSSRLVVWLQAHSDAGNLFFVSLTLYGLSVGQLAWITGEWMWRGFGPLAELGAIIRMIDLAITATLIFSLDFGLGIIRIVDFNEDPGESELEPRRKLGLKQAPSA